MAEQDKKEDPKSKKPQLPDIQVKDGMVIGAPSMGIWVVQAGKRRSVVDVRNQIALGIGMHHVVMLHPEQLEAVPEGEPMPRRR